MSKRRGFGVVVSLVMVAGGLTVAAVRGQAAAMGALDGKNFIGQVGKQGKATGDKDEFRFQAGTFRSTACDRYGFKEAAYTSAMQGDAVTFQAQAVSPTDGTMLWKGTARGEAIEGTTVWSKKAGSAPEAYWFKGTLKR